MCMGNSIVLHFLWYFLLMYPEYKALIIKYYMKFYYKLFPHLFFYMHVIFRFDIWIILILSCLIFWFYHWDVDLLCGSTMMRQLLFFHMLRLIKLFDNCEEFKSIDIQHLDDWYMHLFGSVSTRLKGNRNMIIFV